MERPHVFGFLIHAFPSKIWFQMYGESMHGEMNKNDFFDNLIRMIVQICEKAQFTRATPGSSLVSRYEKKYGNIF